MSTLFSEMTVEVVKITIAAKDGGSTTSYYLSQQYYAAGELYTASPVIYPVLADSVAIQRTVGLYAQDMPDINFTFLGKSDLDIRFRGLADLASDYDFHNGTIELRYYVKPIDAATTHADAVNIRYVGMITDVQYGPEGKLVLRARQQFFRDKSFAKYFKNSQFSDLDPDWVGELRPTVFGQYSTALGVVIPGIYVLQTKTDGSGYRTRIRYFLGNSWTDNMMNALSAVYVQNVNKTYDQSELLAVTIQASADTAVFGSAPTTTANSLNTKWYGLKITPSNNVIVTHAKVRLRAQPAALVTQDGELRVVIYEANFSTFGVPERNIVGKAVIVNTNVPTSAGDVDVVFDKPVIMSSAVTYLATIEWSNDSSTNQPYCYTGIAGINEHFEKDNNVDKPQWVGVGTAVPNLRLYALGYSAAGFEDYTSSSEGYSYVEFQTLDETSIESQKTSIDLRTLDFKFAVRGIEDDGSGTYTGSANSLISNPADLIRYLAADTKYGALGTSAIDSTSFNNARSKCSTVSAGCLIDEPMTVEELVLRLCKQFRLIIYKTREGKLALRYPVPVTSTYDLNITQARYRGDLQVLAVDSQPYSSVINDALIAYEPDDLYVPKDTAKVRRAKRRKYKNAVYVNNDDQGTSDSIRDLACSRSVAKYGVRMFRDQWDYIHEEVSANNTMEYYIDRFAENQKRAMIRVPRKDFYSSVDLFTVIRFEHTEIPSAAGTSDGIAEYNAGAEITPRANGVKLQAWTGGIFVGEVVRIIEVGDYLELTIETVSSFEG